jgi:hypothetical protein
VGIRVRVGSDRSHDVRGVGLSAAPIPGRQPGATRGLDTQAPGSDVYLGWPCPGHRESRKQLGEGHLSEALVDE